MKYRIKHNGSIGHSPYYVEKKGLFLWGLTELGSFSSESKAEEAVREVIADDIAREARWTKARGMRGVVKVIDRSSYASDTKLS